MEPSPARVFIFGTMTSINLDVVEVPVAICLSINHFMVQTTRAPLAGPRPACRVNAKLHAHGMDVLRQLGHSRGEAHRVGNNALVIKLACHLPAVINVYI